MTAPDRGSAGYFLSFEGGEGTGKTTQTDRLQRRLREANYQVVSTREPGGTEIGARLLEVLLHGSAPGKFSSSAEREDRKSDLEASQRPHPMGEALLYSFDRVEHLEKVVRPALQAGKFVLCDRFADSTLAYQGYAQGVDIETITALIHLVVGETWPDLTFVLDMAARHSLARAHERGEELSYFERKKLEFHEGLRHAYLQIARDESHRCVVIDADRPVDQVSGEIEKICQDRLGIVWS